MRRFVLMSVVLILAFAPAPLPRNVRRQANPLGDLAGHWLNSRAALHITFGRYTHSAARDYELTIDRTVTPHTFDIRGIGQENAGWFFVGIYKVEGDTLTVSYTETGPRPTKFDGQDAGFTEVFKRVR